MNIEELETALARYINKDCDKSAVESAISTYVKNDANQTKNVFSLLKEYIDNNLISANDFAQFARYTRNHLEEVNSDDELIDDDDKTQIFQKGEPEDDKTVVHLSSQDDPNEDKTVIGKLKKASSKHIQPSITPIQKTSNSWSKPFTKEDDTSLLKVGSIIKDRFKLIEFIGRGGMGDVFKAEDFRRLDAGDVETEVAVKVLNKEFREHPDSLRALQREARKTQSLAHPHIVNVYDFDRDNVHVFMTMEFMDGRPLNEVIKEQKDGFEMPLARKYIGELCEALQYAHRRGIVHSDLKPNNIFVTNNKEVKIFDFGIARAANIKTNSSEKIDEFDAADIGALTPGYASPEMLDNSADANVRDDIYALGCIAYEILTGSHPFIMNGKKVPANQARKNGMVAPRIKNITKKQQAALDSCLAFERSKRSKSVEEFKTTFFGNHSLVSTKKLTGLFLGSLFIGSICVYGYDYYQNRDVNSLITILEEAQQSVIEQRVRNVLTQDKKQQLRIFENRNVKPKLRDYLRQLTNQQTQQDELTKALLTLELAANIYPDSIEIDRQLTEVVELQKRRIIELYTKLDDILRDKEQVTEKHSEIAGILNNLSKVDSDNKRLSNTQPLFKLQDNIANSIETGNLNLAGNVVTSAFEIIDAVNVFEEFRPQIVAFQSQIDELKTAKLNKQRVADLLDTTQITEDSTLSSFLEYSDSLNLLLELAPNHPEVIYAIKILNSKIDQQIDSHLINKEWQAAIELSQKFKQLMSTTKFNQVLINVETTRATYVTELTKIVQNIRDFARNEQPAKATKLLKSVDPEEFDRAKIQALVDSVATSWLIAARQNKSENQWEEAIGRIESGLSLDISESLLNQLEEEKSAIRIAKDTYKARTIEQEELMEAEANKRIVEKYTKYINSRLGEDSFSIAELSALQNNLDGLRAEDPENILLNSAPKQISQIVVSQIVAQGRQNPRNALIFAEEAKNLVAEPQEIVKAISQLNQQVAQQQEADRQQNLISLENKIVSSIENAKLIKDFDNVKQLLSDYASMQVSSIRISQLSDKSRVALTDIATLLTRQFRFDQAKKAIAKAAEFGLSEKQSESYITEISKAEQINKKELKKKQRTSQIESITQSLMAFLETGDFASADRTKQELYNLGSLPSSITLSITKAYGEAYFEESNRYYEKLDLASADSWLDKALVSDPSNSTYKSAKPRYRAVYSILNAKSKNRELAKKLKSSAIRMFPDDQLIKTIEIQSSSLGLSQIKSVNTPTANRSTSTYNSVNSVPCSQNMAGNGIRFTCRDALTASFNGPYLIVLPEFKGKQFAITKYEVRIGEYNIYCTETGKCQAVNGDELNPVTGLNLSDIGNFIQWISEKTGSTYRLPTVSEWRFAAKADGKPPNKINCSESSREAKLESVNFEKNDTSNSWGFSNFLGNAQEIVTVRNGFAALGGHYLDDVSKCSVRFSRFITQEVDEFTGFRLVKELD